MLRPDLQFATVLAILIVGTAAHAGSIADLDEKNGFRDAKFGMRKSEIHGLNCQAEQYDGWDEQRLENFQQCTRPDEHLNIGSIKLTGISYFFLKDRLVKVFLNPGMTDDERFKELFMSMWGAPSESIRGPAASIGPGMTVRLRHLWRGKRVHAELSYRGAGLPFWCGEISSAEFEEYKRGLKAADTRKRDQQLQDDARDF